MFHAVFVSHLLFDLVYARARRSRRSRSDGADDRETLQETSIDFLNSTPTVIASVVVIAVGLVSLVVKGGPELGIDFTGGRISSGFARGRRREDPGIVEGADSRRSPSEVHRATRTRSSSASRWTRRRSGRRRRGDRRADASSLPQAAEAARSNLN